MNKENRQPMKKQGIQYEIFTDKNNGVYLSKDIAHDNYLSLTLLTKQAQQAHKSYVNTFMSAVKQPQNLPIINKNLSEVESFNENYRFCSKQLQKIRQDLQKCSQNNKIIRRQFESLKQSIQSNASELQQIAAPAFKNLHQKIKSQKVGQTATYSKMKRQIDNIQQCFGLVKSGLRHCDKKATISQQKYGIIRQLNDGIVTQLNQ